MEIAFNQRFGIVEGPPKVDTFPDSARNGLMYIFEKLIKENLIQNTENKQEAWAAIYIEMLRTSKSSYEIIDPRILPIDLVDSKLHSLKWNEVYTLCERVYLNLINEYKVYDGYHEEWIVRVSYDDAKNEYEREINNLLSEENLPYIFGDGEFSRPGRPQTQKSINRAASVLSRIELRKVRDHFNKAIEFFSSPTNVDYQNSVKESLISLEMAAEILSGEKVSKDFTREMQKLGGTEDDKIPSPIITSMIKIFAYRGTAEGVVHGVSEGLRVSSNEAELILSLVASYITYLVSFFDNNKDKTPF